MASIDLTARLRLAGEYIAAHGWTQNTMHDAAGQVCLTGAVRNCAPRDGDEHIIREVLRDRNRAEIWNDATSRTVDEVTEYLAAAHITDADLAGTFGPQWAEIVALVRAVTAFTPEQVEVMTAFSLTAFEDEARNAARYVADAVAARVRSVGWEATWSATRYAARDVASNASTARDAAWGLVVRDLIGQHGLKQGHYDALTGPWRKTIGRIHADDADLA